MLNIGNAPDFSNIGKVSVTRWGQKDANGEANDCYWNIARNQLGEGASAQEINDLTNKLLALNSSKDAQGNYDPMLYSGQQIILDIDTVIKQSNEAIQEIIELYSQIIQEGNQKSQDYNSLVTTYNDKIAELGQYNQQFAQILNEFQNSQQEELKQPLVDILNTQADVEANILETEDKINQTTNPIDEQFEEIEEIIKEKDELISALNALREEYLNANLSNEELEKLDNFIEEFDKQMAQMELQLTPIEQQQSKEAEIQRYQENSQQAIDLKIAQKDENNTWVVAKNENQEIHQENKEEVKEEKSLDFKNFESLKGFLDNPNLTSEDLIKTINDFNKDNTSLAQFIDKNYNQEKREELSNLLIKKLDSAVNEGNSEAITILCQEIYNSTAAKLGTADEYIKAIVHNSSDETICQIIENYNLVTNSELYNDIKNDFSGYDEELILSKFDKTYENTRKKLYTGWNDGKLSNSEKLEAIGQGVSNKMPQVAVNVVFAAAAPTISTAVGTALAGTAIGAAVPFIAPILIVAGIGVGGYLAYKGIKEGLEGYNQAKNAQTDSEAKSGIIQATEGSIQAAEGAVVVVSSVKSGINLAKSLKNAPASNVAQEAGAKTAQEAVKTASQAQTQSSINYGKILNDFDKETRTATVGIRRFKALRCLNNVVAQENSPEIKEAYDIFMNNQNDETLKKLYRTLSKATHPDIHPNNPSLAEGFSLYNRLYEILAGNMESIKF